MTQAVISIEQLRQLADTLQRDLDRLEKTLSDLDSLPDNASAEQMLRVMIDIARSNTLAQIEDLKKKLDSLKPAMANIILAAPVPGGPRQ